MIMLKLSSSNKYIPKSAIVSPKKLKPNDRTLDLGKRVSSK